jgi:probable phosphoglycerate mutase
VREGLRDLARAHAGQRVLVVVHDVVVLLLRQAIEGIPDEQVWFLGPVHNGSITRWADDGGGLRLVEFNATAHLSG